MGKPDYQAEHDAYESAKKLLEGPLTPEVARRVVETIRFIADDDECAHALEDRLRERVLVCVAEGCADAEDTEEDAELARIALSTRDIEFSRWCA